MQRNFISQKGERTMIDKDGYSYMVVCDNCGEGAEVDTWDEVLEYIKEEGWKKRLVDGEFKHYCPECQEG